MKYAANALGRVLATQAGYDIVTALRGPDSQDSQLKWATVEVIRYKVGILPSNSSGCLVSPDSEEKAEYRASLGRIETISYKKSLYLDANKHSEQHFLGHAFRAFEALGLKWGEVNE